MMEAADLFLVAYIHGGEACVWMCDGVVGSCLGVKKAVIGWRGPKVSTGGWLRAGHARRGGRGGGVKSGEVLFREEGRLRKRRITQAGAARRGG